MGWLQHELSVWLLVLASVFAGSASSKHQLLVGVGSNSSLAAPLQGGAPGAGRGKKKRSQGGQVGQLVTFTKDTAKKTDQSDRKVRCDATRGENVKVLCDILGTCLDQGKELDASGKLMR
jgi:hypothetical protein